MKQNIKKYRRKKEPSCGRCSSARKTQKSFKSLYFFFVTTNLEIIKKIPRIHFSILPVEFTSFTHLESSKDTGFWGSDNVMSIGLLFIILDHFGKYMNALIAMYLCCWQQRNFPQNSRHQKYLHYYQHSQFPCLVHLRFMQRCSLRT